MIKKELLGLIPVGTIIIGTIIGLKLNLKPNLRAGLLAITAGLVTASIINDVSPVFCNIEGETKLQKQAIIGIVIGSITMLVLQSIDKKDKCTDKNCDKTFKFPIVLTAALAADVFIDGLVIGQSLNNNKPAIGFISAMGLEGFITSSSLANIIKDRGGKTKDVIIASVIMIVSSLAGLLMGKIFSNKLLIDNKAKIYTIKENVTLKNENNEITLNANEVIFDQGKNTIKSIGKTRINKNNSYFLETSNIIYDLNTKKIFSNENTILKDLEPNEINVQNFKLDLSQNTFVANNVLMTDKELNIFSIKKIYYDFNNERILGQDILINDLNELSTKRYLARAKGKSFIYENGDFTLNKGIYTNCKKREGCSPWSIAAKEVKHDKKNKLVKYNQATFKLYDVPIVYFPKFFHPDPTVKRQSGFLAPSILSQNSADYLKTPYFFAISEDSDFTFSPRFYSDQKNIYQGGAYNKSLSYQGYHQAKRSKFYSPLYLRLAQY